jgi:hypothetical protein
MKIGDKLLKAVTKKFAPLAMTYFKFGRYDVAVKTDIEGNAVTLFIGTADETGHIKGTRFKRVFTKSTEGKIIKDHWDQKGQA